MFFEPKHKRLALSSSPGQLNKAYKKSERVLKKVARCGDEQELAAVMERHRDIEYALLFQKTPNFNKRKKKYDKETN